MKKNVKKWVVGCLAALVFMSGISGCGHNNGQMNDSSQPKSKTIVDIAGDSVQVPMKVKKIAVTPLPWASVVYALDGGSERLGAIHPGAKSAYKGHFLEKMDKHFGQINSKNINQDFTDPVCSHN